MTTLSVYIASSLDGYIATDDDALDWLEAAARPDEDYGFASFLDDVDALAMGRRTYDHIAHLDPLPFGDRPVFVFTHHPPRPRAGVTFWDLYPTAALAHWRATGLGRVYVDGGTLIGDFLAEGLVDDMTLTTAPVLLGRGRPLFPRIAATSAWRLESVRQWPSGMVQRHYQRHDADPAVG
jgi:dihydrofolate reductase